MIAKKDDLSFDPPLKPNIKGPKIRPPLANRGVTPPPQKHTPYGDPVARGLDFATITVGPEARDWLLSDSDKHEDGRPTQGFQTSEKRITGMSANGYARTVWRKFHPHEPSSRWGLEYESWEADGPAAHHFIMGVLAGPVHDMRPSRIDVAWDYHVMETDDADGFADMVRPHCKSKGIKLGTQGDEGTHTKYIGSRESMRRIRVYRKDWRQPQFFPVPTLRLELILRGDMADAWWPVFCQDQEKGYAAAASHLHDMTGIMCQELGEIPPQPERPNLKATETLFHAIKQYGPVISAAAEAGIDVPGLCRLRSEVAFRHTKLKQKRALQEFVTYGIAEAEEYISMRIA